MKYKVFGFTLAEVLITLGIIGIIAEITIPTLLSTINDMHYKNAAREVYSKVSQAITQMKTDTGDNVIAYYQGNWPGFYQE